MSDVLRNAYGLHQAGRLAEAARAYDEIINADPTHFDAHFLLGLIHLQSGRFLEVKAAFDGFLDVRAESDAQIAAMWERQQRGESPSSFAVAARTTPIPP